jgi:hypothetical protein
MLSQTHRGLEDFDNQHDFERMAADILNGLGYSHVEPMAPLGGPDGGRDILFKDGEAPGLAFVTLNKNIRDKFKADLAKQSDGAGLIALFCNVDVSPATKLAFAKDAISKGFRMEIFDLERLRSLLDSSLRNVRRRYLGIDDEVSERLRSEIRKLLRFPDAAVDSTVFPTLIERLLLDKLPGRLFDLLIRYEESDVIEIPTLGPALDDHLKAYYRFRQAAQRTQNDLETRISQIVKVRFRAAWSIYFQYAAFRWGGLSKESIAAGDNFLNYDITWDDAETVFDQLSADSAVRLEVSELLRMHKRLVEGVANLKERYEQPPTAQ